MILDPKPPANYGIVPKEQQPVDTRRVWGMTGWEDQSGHRHEDGSWPWAGLPAWQPDTKRYTY